MNKHHSIEHIFLIHTLEPLVLPYNSQYIHASCLNNTKSVFINYSKHHLKVNAVKLAFVRGFVYFNGYIQFYRNYVIDLNFQ